MEKSYVDKLVARKSLALSLSNTSPDFFMDQNRFLPDLFYIFSQYLIPFLIAVRQDDYNLKSSVIIQELELAIYITL